jgi:hypothetical protein
MSRRLSSDGKSSLNRCQKAFKKLRNELHEKSLFSQSHLNPAGCQSSGARASQVPSKPGDSGGGNSKAADSKAPTANY